MAESTGRKDLVRKEVWITLHRSTTCKCTMTTMHFKEPSEPSLLIIGSRCPKNKKTVHLVKNKTTMGRPKKKEKEKREVAIPAASAASVNYIKSADKIAQQRNVGRAETLGFYCSNAHQTSKPLKLDFLQEYSTHCIRMGSLETSNHNAFCKNERSPFVNHPPLFPGTGVLSTWQISPFLFSNTVISNLVAKAIDSTFQMRVHE